MSKQKDDILNLYAEIEKFVDKFYLNRMVKGGIIALGVFSISYLFFSSAAYFFELMSWIRLCFLIGFIGLNLIVFIRLFLIPFGQYLRIIKRITQVEAASYIGKMFPDISDRLLNTLQLINQSTSANENLVRPSEVLSAIKANKISQKDFLNFLTNHTTYQNFKRIQNFNFEQFTQDILSKPKQVDKFLRKLGLDPTTMRDKTKIRKVLEATYNYIVNTTISNYSDMLKQSILDELIGFQGEQQVMFTNFIKKVTRFKKPEDFYKYYEKQFKYVADEMIRKISKVYSLVDK